MIRPRLRLCHLLILVSAAAPLAEAAPLTTAEIQRIEADLGITLTETEKIQLAQIAKPDGPLPQWRTDAYARIEAGRKANLDIHVVDALGNPVQGAEVSVRLKKNAFKFGGVVQAQDLTDASGNLADAGSTTADWERLVKGLFNAVGTANNLKPRLTSLHLYLPNFLTWASSNGLDVRGHLLIWPGTGGIAEMDTPGNVLGVDYGLHLSQGWPESLNSVPGYEGVVSYNVQAAVSAYKASARTQADKNAVKAVVDAEIQQWASLWNVYEWDVINETLSNRLLMEIMGYGQMAEWFNIAHANKVNPDCKLLINEFQIISAMSEQLTPGWYTNRRDQLMANIDRILADGGQIDGIGFQSRIKNERRNPQLIYDRLKEWGDRYGMMMAGTEFEVVDTEPGAWKEYIYTETERAEITEEMLTQYFSHPLVTGINAWTFMHGSAVEALARYDGSLKLNGLVWYYLHRIRYNTDESLLTDAAGKGTVRGFKGEYQVIVSYGGQTHEYAYTLQADDSLVLPLGGPTTTSVIEQWDFAGNSLIGVNGTPAGFFDSPTATKVNADQTGGAFNNTFTVNRSSGFSGNVFSPELSINSGNADTITLQFTLAAWDLSHTALSNGGSGSGFGIRLRNASDQNVMFLQVRSYKDSGGVEYLRLQGTYFNGTSTGQSIQGGYAAASLTGATPITVGLTLDLNAETYTFWMGDPGADDGSAWNNRFASHTGSAPGISSQTITSFSWALNPFVGNGDMTGDFVELDQVIMSTSSTTYHFKLTSIQVSGGNLVIDFTGTPGTAWTVWGSNNLSGFSEVTGVSTLVESPPGVYNATVPMAGNPYFVRFGTP